MSTFGQNLNSLLIVVIFAAFGGFIVKLVQGITLPGGKVIKPFCSAITVPPLVGMIICGCVSRNFFGEVTNDHYP
jgi:ACR3 family arsenite efflux pump ArsB